MSIQIVENTPASGMSETPSNIVYVVNDFTRERYAILVLADRQCPCPGCENTPRHGPICSDCFSDGWSIDV